MTNREKDRARVVALFIACYGDEPSEVNESETEIKATGAGGKSVKLAATDWPSMYPPETGRVFSVSTPRGGTAEATTAGSAFVGYATETKMKPREAAPNGVWLGAELAGIGKNAKQEEDKNDAHPALSGLE